MELCIDLSLDARYLWRGDVTVGKAIALRRRQFLGKELSLEPLAVNTPAIGAMSTSVLKGELDKGISP